MKRMQAASSFPLLRFVNNFESSDKWLGSPQECLMGTWYICFINMEFYKGIYHGLLWKLGLPKCLSLLSQSCHEAATWHAGDNIDCYLRSTGLSLLAIELNLSLVQQTFRRTLTVWKLMGFPMAQSRNQEVSNNWGELSSLNWPFVVSKWILFLISMCVLLCLLQVYYPELSVWVSQEPFPNKEMEGRLPKVRSLAIIFFLF